MKLVQPGHRYISHEGLTPQQFIEKIGRICYKSTDKITEDSAAKFVDNLIKNKHFAMLEHETVYVRVSNRTLKNLIEQLYRNRMEPNFLHITYDYDCQKENIEDVRYSIISGNIRSFYDIFIHTSTSPMCPDWNKLLILFQVEYPWAYSSIQSEYIEDTWHNSTGILSREEFINYCKYINNDQLLFHHLTHTVKFICDRGVSHELVRHRPCSFAQESTRYCNYSNDKFGNEITVIEPIFYKDKDMLNGVWRTLCLASESAYFTLLARGSTPQEARDVLPQSLKTEIVLTATEEEWQHIVDLRSKGTTGKPHPQMLEIMQPCHKELNQITEGRIR